MNKEIDITGVVLTSARLTLRPWRESDLADFNAYARVDGVGQMAGWKPHRDLEESRAILSHFIAGKHVFALEHQGKVIGSLGIEKYNEANYPELAELQGRELGYVLSKDYWGRGLMPEAVRTVIAYLFDVVGLDFILVGHFDWNAQSRRVIEKCGFRYIKTTEYETKYDTVEASMEYIRYHPGRRVPMPTHKGTQTIETPRLILRRAQMADAQPMFANWASDLEVTKFLTWPAHSNPDVTKTLLQRWLDEYEKDDDYQWMIVLKELGQPIGSIGVGAHHDQIGKAEIGYCIGKTWWHKGIMTEALKAVMDFLFREVGLNRIEARHDPNNPHSGGVMKKCGMQYEGTARAADRNNQGICDAAHYAILRSEWAQLNPLSANVRSAFAKQDRAAASDSAQASV